MFPAQHWSAREKPTVYWVWAEGENEQEEVTHSIN